MVLRIEFDVAARYSRARILDKSVVLLLSANGQNVVVVVAMWNRRIGTVAKSLDEAAEEEQISAYTRRQYLHLVIIHQGAPWTSPYVDPGTCVGRSLTEEEEEEGARHEQCARGLRQYDGEKARNSPSWYS